MHRFQIFDLSRVETYKEVADDWRVVDDDYGQAVGKLQAESMMSTAASLFPQRETKVCRSGEEQTVRLKVMLDSLVTLQQGRRCTIKRVSASSASSNVEPAHNTTKYFVPNLR
jgi:hypothetical protein